MTPSQRRNDSAGRFAAAGRHKRHPAPEMHRYAERRAWGAAVGSAVVVAFVLHALTLPTLTLPDTQSVAPTPAVLVWPAAVPGRPAPPPQTTTGEAPAPFAYPAQALAAASVLR